MSLVYKKCPSCKSRNAVKIAYGMPTSELYEEYLKGKVVLGGCCVVEGGPEYFCKDCNYEWNKDEVIDNAYGSISNIKAYVGGFFGPNYEVELDFENNKLIWNEKTNLVDIEDSVTKDIDLEQYNYIIGNLKFIKLLGWKRNYIDPGICDGTQWSIDIKSGDKTIHKSGSNNYPRTWEMFCRLIEEITGKKFR